MLQIYSEWHSRVQLASMLLRSSPHYTAAVASALITSTFDCIVSSVQLLNTTFTLPLFNLVSCYDANAKSQMCLLGWSPLVVPITLTGNICTTCKDGRCKGYKPINQSINQYLKWTFSWTARWAFTLVVCLRELSVSHNPHHSIQH